MYVIIELNNNYTNIFTRNETYAFSVINAAYGTDDKSYYTSNIKAILFNLNWSNNELGREREERIVYKLPRSYADGDFLLKMVNINLDRYVDKDYNNIGNYEKLFKLFTVTSKKELIKLTKGDEFFELYCRQVIFLLKEAKYKTMILSDIAETNLAAAERETYAEQKRMDGINEGLTIGRNEGLAIGRQEEKEQFINNMYNDNLSLDTIAKYANLSIDKVKDIIRRMTSK